MPGPTTAALEVDIRATKERVENVELAVREGFKHASEVQEKHEEVDRQEFEVIRESIAKLLAEFNELKLLVAEHLAVQQDVGSLKKDVESLKLTRAGNKPWMEMLIKLIWALLGAGAAWLLSHGGLGGP